MAKKIKNDFLAISVIWEIWVAKLVLLCLVPQTFKGFWISYSRREIWERNRKSVRWLNNWEALKKPEKIHLKFLCFCKKQNLETKLILNIRKLRYTVKPLYSRHPRFLKKTSAIRRYQLYRVLNFFEEKIIIDKNLTVVYVNCDSL